jgi:hypothetical protein
MNWRKIINYWTILIGEVNEQEINLKRVLRGWAELVAVWITCMLLYGVLLYTEGGNEAFIIILAFTMDLLFLGAAWMLWVSIYRKVSFLMRNLFA